MYSATNVKPGEEVASLVALEMGSPPGKRRRVHEGAQAVHMPVHILEDLQLVDTGEEAVSLHTQSGGGAQCWPGEASMLAAVKHEVGLMHMHTASRTCAGASVLEDLQLVAPGEEVVSPHMPVAHEPAGPAEQGVLESPGRPGGGGGTTFHFGKASMLEAVKQDPVKQYLGYMDDDAASAVSGFADLASAFCDSELAEPAAAGSPARSALGHPHTARAARGRGARTPPPPGTGRSRAGKGQAWRPGAPTGPEAPLGARRQGQSRAAAAAAGARGEAQAVTRVLIHLQALHWLRGFLPVAASLRVRYSGLAEAALAAVAAAAAGQRTALHAQGRAPGRLRGPSWHAKRAKLARSASERWSLRMRQKGKLLRHALVSRGGWPRPPPRLAIPPKVVSAVGGLASAPRRTPRVRSSVRERERERDGAQAPEREREVPP